MQFISMAVGFVLASVVTLGASMEPAGTNTRTMAGLDSATHFSATHGVSHWRADARRWVAGSRPAMVNGEIA